MSRHIEGQRSSGRKITDALKGVSNLVEATNLHIPLHEQVAQREGSVADETLRKPESDKK